MLYRLVNIMQCYVAICLTILKYVCFNFLASLAQYWYDEPLKSFIIEPYGKM